MNIIDLEHLETVSDANEIQGATGIDPKTIIGKAIANFSFNSLATGSFGALAGGGPKILTASTKTNSSVGFQFDYSAIAVGIPLEIMGND
jgi:hypothetical protein